MGRDEDEGGSVAEQIPEAWVGQEVTVYFGSEGHRQGGTLESVSERGIVVRSVREDIENVFWYPLTSVIRLLKGRSEGRITLILTPWFA
jgi:hypothetical protein